MPPRVTLVCGRTQQGKSTLALRMALDEWPRVIVLDSARSRVFDRIAPGGQFETWPQLAAWLLGPGSSIARWCVALRSKSPDDYAAVLRAAEHFRGILLLCDETHKLCRMAGVVEPLELAALTGAHYGGGVGVGLYMVAQRAMSVPINVRSQADRIISFRQEEPRDRRWLVEWGASEEFAASVAALPEHQYLTYPPTLTVREERSDEVAALGDNRGRRRAGIGDRGAALPEDAREGERDRLHPVATEVTAQPAPVTAPIG